MEEDLNGSACAGVLKFVKKPNARSVVPALFIRRERFDNVNLTDVNGRVNAPRRCVGFFAVGHSGCTNVTPKDGQNNCRGTISGEFNFTLQE